jgi:hypothetical protein
MDLYSLTPFEVRQLMDSETDPDVLRCLVQLEAAAHSDDDLERTEAIGALSDLLVLNRGMGF